MIQDIKCDHCGRPATILRCTPVYRPTHNPFAEERYRVTEISCKISCLKCGPRVQLMEAAAS